MWTPLTASILVGVVIIAVAVAIHFHLQAVKESEERVRSEGETALKKVQEETAASLAALQEQVATVQKSAEERVRAEAGEQRRSLIAERDSALGRLGDLQRRIEALTRLTEERLNSAEQTSEQNATRLQQMVVRLEALGSSTKEHLRDAEAASGYSVEKIEAALSRHVEVASAAEALLKQVQGEVDGGLKQAAQAFLAQDADIARDLGVVDPPAVDDFSYAHKHMPLLMVAVACRLPVWLHGDAGSGKSISTQIVASRLGLAFGFISVCPTTTKSDLLGYKDGYGTYHPTEFRRRFEHGGVFLIDEIDNGNPQVLAVVNNALSNGVCAFPDGMVHRHPDCVIIAAANTIGRGANMRYVGRSPVDATTLDRFVFVRMDIDEELEAALVGCPVHAPTILDRVQGGFIEPAAWLARVQSMRHAVARLGIDHMVSPRATLNGMKLIEEGLGLTHVEEMVLWKGMREGDRTKVLRSMRTAA